MAWEPGQAHVGNLEMVSLPRPFRATKADCVGAFAKTSYCTYHREALNRKYTVQGNYPKGPFSSGLLVRSTESGDQEDSHRNFVWWRSTPYLAHQA
jgi:hypothetical protein